MRPNKEASDENENEDNDNPPAAGRTKTHPITGIEVEVKPSTSKDLFTPSLLSSWEGIVKMTKEGKFNFLKARTMSDGIQIFINSLEDLDKLHEKSREHYSY